MQPPSTTVGMLILMLISYCLPVRPAEDTGVRPNACECSRPIFQNVGSRKTAERCVKQGPRNNNEPPNTQSDQIDAKHLIFKNPEFVWGKEFNHSNVKVLCQSCIFARGSNVQRIRFTKKGVDLCTNVCTRQEQRILNSAPTKVLLVDNYCTKKRLLAATCVCIFKITCQEYMHYAFLHFIASRTGEVAMLYFEAGHPLTVNLDNL